MDIRIEAVLFDLDGLMLDSERHGLWSWDLAARDAGCPVPDEIRLAMIGRPLPAIHALLRERMPAGSPVEQLFERANHHYHALLRDDPPAPKTGLLELLDLLHERAIPRAVATSSPTAQAEWKLHQAGVRGRVSHVVGGDQVSRGKPAPDIFLEAARRLAVPPARCVVLEDSGPGLQAAAAAGMHRVWIPDLHAPPPEVRAAVTATFPDLLGARDWILPRLAAPA